MAVPCRKTSPHLLDVHWVLAPWGPTQLRDPASAKAPPNKDRIQLLAWRVDHVAGLVKDNHPWEVGPRVSSTHVSQKVKQDVPDAQPSFAKKLIKILCQRRPPSPPGTWNGFPEFGSAPLFISIIKVEGRRSHKSAEKCIFYTPEAPWPESQRVTTSHNES